MATAFMQPLFSCGRANVNLTGVQYSSDGSNGNRATAQEMGLPTFLKFQRRQHVMRAMLRAILDRVLQEAQNVKLLPSDIETHYDILFPDIDVADNQTLATTTQYLVTALSTAKAQGWVSDETTMRLLFQFAGEEIDIHEEQQRMQSVKAMQSTPSVQTTQGTQTAQTSQKEQG